MKKIIIYPLLIVSFCATSYAQNFGWQDHKLIDHFNTDVFDKVREESVYLSDETLEKTLRHITINDKNHHQNIDIKQVWNQQTKEWLNKKKHISATNESINLYFTWSEATKNWVKKREVVRLDDYSKIKTWRNDSYKEHYQRSVKENNTYTVEIAYSLRPESWENHSKGVVVVENDHKITIKQKWNSKIQNWQNTIKVIENESFDREQKTETYVWDKDLNIWRKHRLKVYIFDENGSNSAIVLHNWNEELGAWEKKNRTLFIRDENRLVQVIKQKWVEMPSDLTVDENELLESSELALCNCTFPNPYAFGEKISCHKFLENSNTDIHIFDLNGKEVFTTPFFDSDIYFQLNGDLISGIYFLVIQEDNNVLLREKLVIQD